MGLGLVIWGSDKAGPLFSFGSPQALIKEVGLESKDSNQLVEVQVFNGSETEKFPSSNSVRVLPTSLRGKPRGTKQGPVNKRQTSQRGARRGGDGGGAVSQNCGKRRLDVLEQDASIEQSGKRVFLGDISNTVGVEAAYLKGPPKS